MTELAEQTRMRLGSLLESTRLQCAQRRPVARTSR